MAEIHIGERVRKLIKASNNWTTASMAAQLKMTTQALYDIYKKQDIHTKNLRGICNALGISMPSVLQDEPESMLMEEKIEYANSALRNELRQIHVKLDELANIIKNK